MGAARLPRRASICAALAASCITGCATAPAPSSSLGEAQQALQHAQAIGAGHTAASALRAARSSLDAAERCEHMRGAAACEDLIYLALRRAQLAETFANTTRAQDAEYAARAAHRAKS